MIVIFFLLSAIAVLDVFWCIKNNNRSDDLDEREKWLEEYSTSLDERRNQIAEEEAQAARWYYSSKEMKDKIDKAEVFRASYVVTEADEIKYSSDKAIVANAKQKMAATIAHDIVKAFEPNESTSENGRRLLSLSFKLVQQDGTENT